MKHYAYRAGKADGRKGGKKLKSVLPQKLNTVLSIPILTKNILKQFFNRLTILRNKYKNAYKATTTACLLSCFVYLQQYINMVKLSVIN